jgi:hypothetical protein
LLAFCGLTLSQKAQKNNLNFPLKFLHAQKAIKLTAG